MLGIGKVHYEIGANTDATSYGGIAAVHRLVTKLGLAREIGRTGFARAAEAVEA